MGSRGWRQRDGEIYIFNLLFYTHTYTYAQAIVSTFDTRGIIACSKTNDLSENFSFSPTELEITREDSYEKGREKR